MVYSTLFFRSNQTKIPTVISLVAVVGIIFLMARFFFSAPPQQSRASKNAVRQMQVVDISQRSARVFWETDAKEVGWVIYGTSKSSLSRLAIDERDLSAKKRPYVYHLARMNDLAPDTVYYFKIVSDNQIISQTGREPFSLRTHGDEKRSSTVKSAYGKIVQSGGTPVENAVVILATAQDRSFAALTKSTGEWLIVLSDLEVTADQEVTTTVFGENRERSTIKARLRDMNPLPQTVIIGQDYVFDSKEQVLAAQTKAETPLPKTREIDIIFPTEELVVPALSPLIKGVAIPASEVFVTVRSPVEYSFKTKAESDGSWKVTVPQNLTPGKHTVTIRTKDKEGKEVTMERTFYIAKSGEQVLGEATASATPAQTPAATATPVPTSAYPPPTANLTPTPPTSGDGSGILYSVLSGGLMILGLGILFVF